MKSGRFRTLLAGTFVLAGTVVFPVVAMRAQTQVEQLQSPNYPSQPLQDNGGRNVAPGKDSVSESAAAVPVSGSFLQRLGRYYWADWHGKLPSAPAPERRAVDSPLDSPPYPSGDWSYGGSPTIGAPDTTAYPLMTAMKLDNHRTKIYGWAKGTYNFSTSNQSNYPLIFASTPNMARLQQVVLFVERLPNTVQNKHFDWGYHVTALYFGVDSSFAAAKGYVLHAPTSSAPRYEYQPLTEYLDMYYPVKDGLNFRIGRFITLPGLDSPLAPSNYTMTRSLAYAASPVTETGVIGTLKVNRQWIVQLGVSAGHDVAPWSSDRKASLHACLDYSTATNRNNFYVCANGINDGKYAYDNVQHYDLTWFHKFNAKWHTATEAWVMYQRDVPNVAGNVENPIAVEPGTSGAVCAQGELRCTAPAYAVVNYLNREINPLLNIGFRSDLLNDKKGQRTGVATKYTENTLYLDKFWGNTVELQTDLRFDHSWDKRGYDNDKARNQLILGLSMIYRY